MQKGASHPVDCVSWNDATAFCRKLGERTGESVRLPTEAEWEHACRAGTTTTYYTGDSENDLDKAAWYCRIGTSGTHPVGQKLPNAWGAYDMHGNICQWCQDCYARYKPEAAVDPLGASEGQGRVLRGGCHAVRANDCRAACRIAYSADYRIPHAGFRVVVEVPKMP
ncbi:MAG TPA: SUMF1/EgtB/PvdO family nonheme iron enzyme [Planctomycetota bacterium]